MDENDEDSYSLNSFLTETEDSIEFATQESQNMKNDCLIKDNNGCCTMDPTFEINEQNLMDLVVLDTCNEYDSDDITEKDCLDPILLQILCPYYGEYMRNKKEIQEKKKEK